MTIQLQLLGAPAFFSDSRWQPLAAERRTQLLVYLALTHRWVGRAELAALLWPDQSPKLAQANLRKTLFRLPLLPWGATVETQGGALRVQAEMDVAAFDQAIAEGRAADAVAQYCGPLLAGFDEDANEAWTRWLGFERERCRAAWRSAALAQLQGDIGLAEGLELAARLLDDDPLDEAALRAQLRLLQGSGQAARARQLWADFARRLHDELGLEPGAELRALRDALGSDSVAAAPWRAVAPAPSDAGFIGRSAELRQLDTLLQQPGCRLVSIVGPGGIGKTRLARRALQTLAAPGSEPPVWVPLEDVGERDALLVRLAGATGLRLHGDAPPLAQLVAALGAQRRLLVLDNFEQLVAEAAVLESLLEGCPGLTLVVTTRVRLKTASEWLLSLGGLPTPEPEDVDELESFDAVRLFTLAARRVEPAFSPRAEAPALIEICRLVEGLPLALELVAAWVRVMPCADIVEELQQGGELLRTVDPARPPRQASVQAVFEQSWQQLGAAEREVLSRLSVCRGGFTVEAARQVAGARAPVLAALADRSLLRKEGSRNFLHPLVQSFAAERLDAAGGRTRTAQAHSRHHLLWLGRQQAAVRRAEREALADVELEFDNVCAAWRHASDEANADTLTAAAQPLMEFCDHRGRWIEGLALFEEAMQRPPVQAQAALLASLQARAAHLLHRLDRYAESDRLALLALPAARATGDLATRLQCHGVLGANAIRQLRRDDARRWYRRSLRLARVAGLSLKVVAALSNLALIAKQQGRVEESLQLSSQALLQHRELGDAAGEAICLTNLSALYMIRGEFDPARSALQSALQLCDRHGLSSTRCLVEGNLADVARRQGDMVAAARHARLALQTAASAGNRRIGAIAHQVLTHVALNEGDLHGARAAVAAALQIALAIDAPDMVCAGVLTFAAVLHGQGEHEGARRVLAFAVRLPALAPALRDESCAQLRDWGIADPGACPWPGLTVDELAHRIVVERDLAHGPLIAQLLGA